MRNWFTLAGVDSRDFGVYISGQGTFSAPEKAYEFYNIPGRNGAIIGSEKRLENATLTYDCFIYSNFNENVANFRTFLLSLDGYQTLTDSYHTDEFRMAVFQGAFEPDVTSKNDAGSFTLTFSCKPQRYLYIGDVQYVYDLLGISLYGTELFVENPEYVGTNKLTADVFPHGYPNFDDANFTVGGTSANPLEVITGTLKAPLYINNTKVFDNVNLGTVSMTSGSIDYISGSITVNSVGLPLPSFNNWSHQTGHIFTATISKTGLDKVKYCTHYTPVSSTTEFTGDAGKITIIAVSGGTKFYLYDPRFSTLASFQNWWKKESIWWIASLTTPQTSSFTPYVPDYPTTPFTIRSDYLGHSGNTEINLMLPYAATEGMENPTKFPAKPLIRVNGVGTVTINNITITVSTVDSYVDIDCEIMDCYEGGTNRNKDVTFSTYDFPELMPGANPVSFTGVTSVEIKPRWWRV